MRNSRLLSWIFPPTCAYCDCQGARTEGDLCPRCRNLFSREAEERCPRCRRPARDCRCGFTGLPICRPSLTLTFYKSERAWGKSDRLTEKLIFGLKEKGAYVPFFVTELADAIIHRFDAENERLNGWLVTWIPRSGNGYRSCGFDQAEETAVRLARRLRLKHDKLFFRGESETEQKQLGSEARLVHAQETIVPVRSRIPNGGKILLIDDILTTGASMDTAARHLLFGGAETVLPVTIAKTMPSPYDD